MEAALLEFLKSPVSTGPLPRSFTMERLKYPENSHEMNDDGKEQVYFLAQILLAHPSLQIEIRGHNDGTESEVYSGPNARRGYSLSQLRADCVLQRLIFLKVPAARMRIKGMGATEPAAGAEAGGRTSEGRQRNRRVEILVLQR